MKIKFILLAMVVVSISFFLIGRGTAKDTAPLHPQTAENLSTAMHGEAFAYAKYLLFAQHARQDGNTKLATLFENTAKTERFEHFAEEAKVAGVVGSDADNLKDAIKGESYEYETMYPKFAEQAKQAGDSTAANRFSEIRQDEGKHRDAFKAALTSLEQKSERQSMQTPATSGH